MGDEIISDFDMPTDDDAADIDIIETLNRFYCNMKEYTEEQNRRHKDPKWQLRNFYIASPKIFDLMTDSETPIDVKAYLYSRTYAGQYWHHEEDDTEGA